MIVYYVFYQRKVLRFWKTQLQSSLKMSSRVAQLSRQKTDIEDIWKTITEDLLAYFGTVCGWTKGPPRHRVNWWWNDNVDIAVNEKRRFWKSWKQGGSREDYLETKRTARRAVYDKKRAAKLEKFENVLGREDDRPQSFKIAEQMTTNQDIVGDKCIRNDRGYLGTSDHRKHLAWKRSITRDC